MPWTSVQGFLFLNGMICKSSDGVLEAFDMNLENMEIEYRTVEENDVHYMTMALSAAENGMGRTSPNPLVGAVIVKDGRVLSVGYHARYGEAHAEVHCIRQLRESAEGATIYVTLEPCSHHGKTPPCVEAIVAQGISRVVVATLDPNPLVSGRGIRYLKEHGIDVSVGICEDEALKLNEPFFHFIQTRTPLMVLKTAMTLDGKIATAEGHSKWISSEASREYAHQLRHRYAAIMAGIGTVLADDPSLNTRIPGGVDPHRIIVDTHARIPLTAKLLNLPDSPARTIIATTALAPVDKVAALKSSGAQVLILPVKDGHVDLSALVRALGDLDIDSVLIEGGADLNYSLLKEGCIHQVIAFIAPMLIGGKTAKSPIGGEGIDDLNDAVRLENIKIQMIGEDVMITGKITNNIINNIDPNPHKEALCSQD